jgi:GNAT superfamily N-acetyltransferase
VIKVYPSPTTQPTNSSEVRLRHEAFRQDINKIFYSNAPNNEPSQATLDRFTESIKDGILNRGIIFLKCVDTSTGEIIGGARYTYYRPKDPQAKERSWEEVEADLTTPEPYPETDVGIWNGLFDLFNSNKKEIIGNRSCYKLDTLITHRDHYRRGVGGLLLGWGMEKADDAGVEMYLESSPMGRPLYARNGFEPVKDVSLDLRRWGGDDELWFTVSLSTAFWV